MARNELLFRGPLIVDGADPFAGGELWATESDGGVAVVAFRPDGARLASAGVARSPEVSFTTDRRLRVAGLGPTGDPLVFEAATERQGQGAWTALKVVNPTSGAVLAESANVEWTNQGVIVVPPGGAARIEFPGARTSVVGQHKWIEPWDGDPAARLRLDSTTKPCGCGA